MLTKEQRDKHRKTILDEVKRRIDLNNKYLAYAEACSEAYYAHLNQAPPLDVLFEIKGIAESAKRDLAFQIALLESLPDEWAVEDMALKALG